MAEPQGKPTRSIPEELLEKWASYNDIMWTLTPIKHTIPNKEISHILEGVNYNPLTFINSYKIPKFLNTLCKN